MKYFEFEPVREKTDKFGFRPGPTQTRLYSHSLKLKARILDISRRGIVLCLAKTKFLISCAVTK